MHNRYLVVDHSLVWPGVGDGPCWWQRYNRAAGSLCFSGCWPLNSFFLVLIPSDIRAKYAEVGKVRYLGSLSELLTTVSCLIHSFDQDYAEG